MPCFYTVVIYRYDVNFMVSDRVPHSAPEELVRVVAGFADLDPGKVLVMFNQKQYHASLNLGKARLLYGRLGLPFWLSDPDDVTSNPVPGYPDGGGPNLLDGQDGRGKASELLEWDHTTHTIYPSINSGSIPKSGICKAPCAFLRIVFPLQASLITLYIVPGEWCICYL